MGFLISGQTFSKENLLVQNNSYPHYRLHIDILFVFLNHVILYVILIDTSKIIMKIGKNQLYTTGEVANILKVSAVTIKRYISNDKISSIKFNGIRRIKGEDLQKILNTKKHAK